MTTLTAADTYFTNIDNSITATQWESIIDSAIDKINAHGAKYDVELPNMAGSAGSKTWTGLSAEAGWIRTVATAVYGKEYQNEGASSESYGIGTVSHSHAMSDIEDLAEQAALSLRDLDISVGPDASF